MDLPIEYNRISQAISDRVAEFIPPGAKLADSLPSQVGTLTYQVIRANGTVEEPNTSTNARINVGFTQEMAVLFSGTATSTAAFNYIALSSSTLTIGTGDTTLAGEITATGSGLTRFGPIMPTVTVPTTVNGAGSIVFTHAFTSAATTGTVIASFGLFNASSAGTMYSELNLANATMLYLGDSITLAYTITK